jgi:hypothetical protein
MIEQRIETAGDRVNGRQSRSVVQASQKRHNQILSRRFDGPRQHSADVT